MSRVPYNDLICDVCGETKHFDATHPFCKDIDIKHDVHVKMEGKKVGKIIGKYVPMTSKHILVTKCGECPYIEGEQLMWFCNEPSGIDSYGMGVRLGDNSMETLNNIPEWCPLGGCKYE